MVVACLALPAIGQNLARGTDEIQALPKIEVTGSYIPTAERETALPVQVITREEIERANIKTAAQLVNTISATTSYSAFNEAQGANRELAGFAGGALRGLGYQFTLVLINGRRIANYAFAARGADLNAIPISAIERAEVLKDGASAIYGSDAIGGVINFILRSEYRGVDISAQYTSPEDTGGYGKQLNASVGFGDLAVQHFNVYANVDYQKFGGIEARDRAFAARSYIPEEGVNRTTPESFPANVDTPAGLRNPTGDPASGYRNPTCAPPLSSPGAGKPYECSWFGDGSTTIVDPSERLHLVGALTWQFDPNNQLFLYATWARNQFTFTLSPSAVSTGFGLPSTSAFYPHDFARAFGIDGQSLNIHWRAQELGPQTIEPTTEQWNIVAGMQGTAMGWSYNGAFDYSRGEVDNDYANGFVRKSVLLPLLSSGIVNPFGPNTQDVIDRMSSATIDGILRTGTSSLASFDLHAAKDVVSLPAGPLAVAAGFDVLHESLTQQSDPALASGDIVNVTSSPSMSASRDVWAAFAEARLPVLESLDAIVAVRYDHYSDFGGTTNPKASLRWQPVPQLVLRGSAGTGFLAPGLQGLYGPATHGVTFARHDDPARCPFTLSPQDCGRQFPTLGGGNPLLQPATSSQWTAGGVWAPTRELSVGVDYVSILVDNRINFFSDPQIFNGCPNGLTGPTCYLIHRGPVDPLQPTLPGPIVQVDQFLTNLGKKKVTAIDVSAQYVAPRESWGQLGFNFTGTYNIEYLEQQLNGSYVDLVGTYSTSGGNPGVIPRWRHYFVIDWNYGTWSATVTETYQTGALDQAPTPLNGTQQRRIGDYDIWNAAVTYAGFPNWSLSAGIKNLFDHDPPFSIQNQSVQIGYDPSYADPHGRLYWAGARYAFK